MKKLALLFVLGLIFGFNTVKTQAQNNIVVDSLLVLVPQNLDTTGFSGYLNNLKAEWENEILKDGTPGISNVELHWEVKILPVDSYFSYYQDRDSLHVFDSVFAHTHPWTYVTYVTDANDRLSFTGRLENEKFIGWWQLSTLDGRSKYMASHEMSHGFNESHDYISNPLHIWDPITNPDQHIKRSLMSYGVGVTIPYLSPEHAERSRERYISRGGVASIDTLLSPVTPELGETLTIHDSLKFCWKAIYTAKTYNISLFEEGVSEAIVDTTIPAYFFDEETRLITINRCLTVSATLLKQNAHYIWKVVGENDYTIGTHKSTFNFSISQITDVKEISKLPTNFTLYQNYPNPFNPTTNIRFSIPESNTVELIVYNVLGQKVTTLVNEYLSAGTHQSDFNAMNLSGGVYIYTLRVGNHYVESKKMILLK